MRGLKNPIRVFLVVLAYRFGHRRGRREAQSQFFMNWF